MYGLVMLLGLLALTFAFEWVRPDGRPGWGAWAGYVLAATAALYTQYYAALLLLALNLVVFGSFVRASKPVRRLWTWLGAQAAVALLYLPWVLYAGGKLLTYVQNKVSADQDLPLSLPTYLARHVAALIWGHAEGALSGWWWLGLLPAAAIVVALLALVLAGRRGPRGAESVPLPDEQAPASYFLLPLAFILVTVIGCGYLVNVAFPFNPVRGERLLLVVLPVLLLLLAAGLLALWRRRPGLAVGVAAVYVVFGLVSLAFFYAVPRYPDDDYRPLAARVQALAQPADAIVAVHPWQAGYFKAYLRDPAPEVILSPHEVLPRERQYWADDPARMAADLDTLLAGHTRLWLPAHQAMGRILEDQIEAYLAGTAYPVLSEWYGEHSLLSLFAGGEPETRPVSAAFGDWLALKGAALSDGTLPAGTGVLDTRLTWQVAGALPPNAADYRVGLRLVDGAGRVWAQRDSLPLGGLGSFATWGDGEPHDDRLGLLVPAGTPPGEYQVTLRVYNPHDFGVLPATFADGSGGEVVLGTVDVQRPEQPQSPEALSIEKPLRADLGPLRLLGYTRPEGVVVRNGEEAGVDLFWQALAAPGEDYLPRLQLVDASGQAQAELMEKPVGGTYPTAWWEPGELVRDPHALTIPAQVPPGRYRLALSLVRAADGTPVLLPRGRTSLDLGEIEVQGRSHYFEPAEPQHTQRAALDASVALAGYDLEGTAAPGTMAALTLYWQALQTPGRPYYSFVHVLDEAGHIVAQHDGVPGEGELPAPGWLPGETLPDRHIVALPAGLPPDDYRLGVGLYDPRTGQRLGERIILDTPLTIR
jgi:hypothetical protein